MSMASRTLDSLEGTYRNRRNHPHPEDALHALILSGCELWEKRRGTPDLEGGRASCEEV